MKKKSNKIFFGFLILLPVMLVVFNLLLRAQYAKGNLNKMEREEPRAIERPLKPFRHLVFNGKAISRFSNTSFQNEVKRFELVVGPGNKPHLALNMAIDRFVKDRYSGDTLYITYEVDRLRDREDIASYDTRQFRLYAPALASFTARKALVEVLTAVQKEPLKVMASDSRNVTFHHMELPALSISCERSYITLSSITKADSLWYEAIGQSAIYFNVPHHFGKIVQGGVDSLASISINGRPAEMQAYLDRQ